MDPHPGLEDRGARPVIPGEEYGERLARVQSRMRELDLDVLVIYGDDRAVFGPANTRWLVDYAPHFESVCLAVPARGVPQAATGAEAESFYLNQSRLGAVHVVDDFCNPDEEYPYARPIPFAAYLDAVRDQLGHEPRRVGMIERLWMPEWLVARWRGLVGEESLVKFDHAWYGLKSRKSPAEIEVMTYAYALAEAGLAAGLAALAPGVSERDLAAEIEYAMRKAGSEGCGIDTIVGSGQRNTSPILTRAYPRVIEGGDLLLFTIAPRYEGYHAAIGRPFMVDGPATAAMAAASSCSIEAAGAIVAAMQVGGRRCPVAAAGLQVFEREGLLAHNVYSGNHTIGTAEFEPPILTSTSDLVLDEDMVFSVDVPCFFAEWGGMRYEDGYRLTRGGPVRMNHSPLLPLTS